MNFFRQIVANRIVGGLLLGIIILGMAVWGIEDIFNGGIGSNIIQAGERGISQQDLDRKFEEELNRARQQQEGAAITKEQGVEFGLLDQVFALEASRLAFLGHARRIGADASPRALTNQVREVEAFKNPVTGEFDLNTYRRVLADNRFTQSGFERDVTDDLTLSYLRDGITAAVAAPDALARLQAVFEGEARTIKLMVLAKTALPEPSAPTEEELMAFYETRKAAFTEPERRAISLLSLSAAAFMAQADVTEEEISALYEATKTRRLATPETRTFVEIAYPSEEAARAAFGALAVGGEIEPTGPRFFEEKTVRESDIVIDAFRADLFSPAAGVGAVVGPYPAGAGWLLGRITAITPGEPKTLDETRDEIRAELALEQAETRFLSSLNELEDYIGQGMAIDRMAEAFGLEAQRFEPVDARGVLADGTAATGLIEAREGLLQAFQLPAGTVSDRFDAGQSTYVVSVDRIDPERLPDFDEIRERVEDAFVFTRSQEALQAAADAIKSTVESGVSTLEEQAEAYGTAVIARPEPVRRRNADGSLPQQVVNAVFGMEEGTVTVLRGSSPEEVLMVELVRIDRPESDELALLAPLAQGQVTASLTNDLMFAFEQEVRNSMDVKTNDAALAAYKSQILDDR